MDWFERLTGFREGTYNETRAKLEVSEGRLRSRVNGRSYGIGHLELLSLATLRTRIAKVPRTGELAVSNISGDVRALHRDPAYRQGLFQVASQFNLLEMVSPSISPEDGVTRYASDLTQGPACAMAAGAATIYRNYFVPMCGEFGQTANRQVDAAARLRAKIAELADVDPEELWETRNGYALPTQKGIRIAADVLGRIQQDEREALKGELQIGVHWDVEVTDETPGDQIVTQAFCSAMPVSYSRLSPSDWRPLALLVLEAAYEATLAAALLNHVRIGMRTVFITRLGGGAFGNADQWIDDAMRLALKRYRASSLDVRIVNYGPVRPSMKSLAAEFDS